MFTKPAGGWADATQTAELTASDGAPTDSLGISVAISGDTIVAGAFDHQVGSNADQGAVYVFTKPTGGWVNATQTAELTASDGAAGDNFGRSVAVSGDTIVAGTQGRDAVYVFTKPAAGWVNATQNGELTTSDGGGFFGVSVAIDGSTIVVGADDHQVGSNQSQGAAYVFMMPAGGWVNMTQTAELTASDGAANDFFGLSVAISGSTIVAGAYFHQVGSNRQGAAYVFTRPAGGWVNMTQTAELTASDGAFADGLGRAVAVSGDTIVAGAPFRTQDQGAAYVFTMPPGGWTGATQSAEVTASDGGGGDFFGDSIAISSNTIAAGADGHNGGQGAGYVFSPAPNVAITSPANGASYVQDQTVTASYSCTAESGATVTACAGTVSNGQPIDTSTPGSHTFTVTAADNFGSHNSLSVSYTVIGKPTIAITSPANGASYAQGETVDAAYSCTAAAGANLTGCTGPVPDGQPIDTSTPGSHTFTVTAADSLGQHTSGIVHYTVAGKPSVAISSPAEGANYGQGEAVHAAYSCTAAGGANLTGCTGPVPDGQPIDTSTPGSHTFTVTAADSLGQHTSEIVHYTVAGKPSVAISSPAEGANYGQGEAVHAAYSCTAAAGANLIGCTGPVPDGQPIDTSTPGSHTFTVTAIDDLGSHTSQTVSYTVISSPDLTGVRQAAHTWQEKKKRRLHAPVGTTFYFTLNQATTVTFKFILKTTGRRVPAGCVAPTKHNRRKPLCTRTTPAGTLTLTASEGANKLRFTGRISPTKVLKPGKYTVQITAFSASGQQSAPQTLNFTIVK